MPLEVPTLPFLDQSPDVLRKVLAEFFDQVAVYVNDLVQPGTIFPFAGQVVPDGWLLCDGATYEKESYEALAKSLGQTWGGTGSQFQVPDFREKVLFGANTGYPLASEEDITLGAGSFTAAAVYYIIKT